MHWHWRGGRASRRVGAHTADIRNEAKSLPTGEAGHGKRSGRHKRPRRRPAGRPPEDNPGCIVSGVRQKVTIGRASLSDRQRPSRTISGFSSPSAYGKPASPVSGRDRTWSRRRGRPFSSGRHAMVDVDARLERPDAGLSARGGTRVSSAPPPGPVTAWESTERVMVEEAGFDDEVDYRRRAQPRSWRSSSVRVAVSGSDSPLIESTQADSVRRSRRRWPSASPA